VHRADALQDGLFFLQRRFLGNRLGRDAPNQASCPWSSKGSPVLGFDEEPEVPDIFCGDRATNLQSLRGENYISIEWVGRRSASVPGLRPYSAAIIIASVLIGR